MTELGEAARKNLSHVSSADDSDSHVHSLLMALCDVDAAMPGP
jgi:hypothetical protein